MAASKECPAWIKEKNIQSVKTKNGLSYLAACRMVEGNTPSPTTRSYVAIVKPSSRSVDWQTMLMWVTVHHPTTEPTKKTMLVQTPEILNWNQVAFNGPGC